jgi:hypothetical protein
MSVFEQVAQGAPTTPANAWPVEVTDGTNVLGTPTHPVRIDPTGTTTQPVEVTDGTNVLGTPTHPVRIDPTGTTTQPVSGTVAVSSVAGTVAVTESGTWNIGTVTAVTGVTNPVTVAQATAANLKATVLNQDGSGNALTSTSGALDSNLKTIAGTAPSTGTGASGAGIPRVTVSNDSAVKVWDGTHTLGVDGNGNAGVSINEVAGSGMGQRLMAASIPVAIASDQSLTVTVGAVYNNQAGTAASGAVPTTAGSYLSIISDLFTWSTLLLTYVPVSGLPTAGGVFQVEGSPDGTNWTPMTGALLNGTPTQVTEYSTSNFAEVSARYNLAGFPYVRVHTLTAFTGTIDVLYSLTTALSDDVSFSRTLLTTQAGDPALPVSQTQYGSGTIPQAQFCQAAVSPVFTTSQTSGTGATFDHDVQPENTIIVTVVTANSGDVAHVSDNAGNLYTMLINFPMGGEHFPSTISGSVWVFAAIHRNLYDPSPVITATVTPGDLFSSFYTVLSEYAGLGAYSLSGTLPWCSTIGQAMTSGSPHFVNGGTISPAVPSVLFNVLLSTFPTSIGPLTYTDGDSAIYTTPRFQGASSSLVGTSSSTDVVIGDQTVAPGTGLTQGWTVFPPAGYSSSFAADQFTIAFPIGAIGNVALANRASDGTLQPLQVDSSNNLKVDIAASMTVPVSIAATVPVSVAATVPVSIAGTLPVSIASAITARIGDSGGNTLSSTSGSLDVYVTGGSAAGTQYTQTNVTSSPTGTVAMGISSTNELLALQTDATGHLDVNVVSTSSVAVSSMPSVTVGTWSAGAIPVTTSAATSGGWSASVTQALSTTAVQVKGSAGQLGGYAITNSNTALAYVFFYNATGPTAGSTTNLVYQIGVPAGGAANIEFACGIVFSSCIYVVASTSPTSSAAPGVGITVTSVFK